MSERYKYTVLKQDGTKEELPPQEGEMDLEEMYRVLGCKTIQLIPQAYYPAEYGKATIYGDEEGRFNSENQRNPHMKVLEGNPAFGEEPEWDAVGDLLVEERLPK